MTAQSPTIRESLNNGVLQQIADLTRALRLGDLLGQLMQNFSYAKVQSGRFTPGSATPTVTFQALGMTPPLSTNYSVIPTQNTTTPRLTAASKTLTQFALLNATAGEVAELIVAEDVTPMTEQVTVTSNAGAMAAAPAIVLDVVAVAATSLGRKVLKIGPASLLPAAGEVVWDGASSLRFNAADAVTLAKVVRVPTAGIATSILNRLLGQQDGQ